MILSWNEEYKKCPAFLWISVHQDIPEIRKGSFLYGYGYFSYFISATRSDGYGLIEDSELSKNPKRGKLPFPEMMMNFFYLFRSNAAAPEGTPPRRVRNKKIQRKPAAPPCLGEALRRGTLTKNIHKKISG